MSMQWAWVQVGGGPTGVELAAEMHDYIKEDLSVHFPSLKVCSPAPSFYLCSACMQHVLPVYVHFNLSAAHFPELH